MGIGVVVTRGFGPSATIPAVVTAGYLAGSAPVPPIPPPTPPTPPPVIPAGSPRIALMGTLRTEPTPIPTNDVPVIESLDGQETGRLDPSWRSYLTDRDAFAVRPADIELPTPATGRAQEAADLALGAMSANDISRVDRLIESIFDQPPIRQWSVFTFIQDTAANLANYPAAAYPTAYYIETDTFVRWRSDGSGWTEVIFPALIKLLGSTAAFPALKRSGTIIQIRLADDSGYSALEVLDEVYGSGWNSKVEVPTKNAVYDKIETVTAGETAALVSDAAYGAGWDGVTTIAPSKNAVYDKIQTITGASGSFTTVDGKTVTVVNGLITAIV